MRIFLYTVSLLLGVCSCSEQYNIAGEVSQDTFKGDMLYLKPMDLADQHLCLDSCRMVHGQFELMGAVDSAVMATIYIDNTRIMPVVVENGDVTIRVDYSGNHVTGTPLNDRLTAFFNKMNRLQNEWNELFDQRMKLCLQGLPPEDIHERVGLKEEQLNLRMERLETDFVRDNYDNALGCGFFIMLCSQYPSPVITEQIGEILAGAPHGFLNHPFVQGYMQRARYSPEEARVTPTRRGASKRRRRN